MKLQFSIAACTAECIADNLEIKSKNLLKISQNLWVLITIQEKLVTIMRKITNIYSFYKLLMLLLTKIMLTLYFYYHFHTIIHFQFDSDNSLIIITSCTIYLTSLILALLNKPFNQLNSKRSHHIFPYHRLIK